MFFEAGFAYGLVTEGAVEMDGAVVGVEGDGCGAEGEGAGSEGCCKEVAIADG